MKHLWKETLTLAMTAIFLFVALAQTADAGDLEEEEEEEEDEQVVLRVPQSIRKLRLRIDGHSYKPKGDTITVSPTRSGRRMFVELVDGNNRTVFASYRKYEEDALMNLGRRSFSVDFKVGAGEITNSAVDELYAERSLSYATLGLQWQPSLLGLSVSNSVFNSPICTGNAPCGQFNFSLMNLGVVAEIAPNTSGSPFFRRIHMAVQGGLSAVRTEFKLKERDIAIDAKDSSVGRYANFEIRVPIVQIWLDFQHGYQEIPVELKDFHYQKTIYQRINAVGVRYAF